MTVASPVGVGFALLAALSLAVQSLAVRVGTRTRSLVAVIAVMFAVNLLVLVPAAVLWAAPDFTVTARAVAAFAVAGVLGSLLARTCYFVGIVRLGSSRAEPLKALFPVVSVFAAAVVLDEPVTPQLLVGIALLVLGGVVVTFEARGSSTAPTGRKLWIAVVFPLAAAVLLGIDPIFTKWGLAEGTSALVGVTIRVVAAAAGFGLYLAWRGVRTGRVPVPTPTRWLLVAALANTAFLFAYYAALARSPVTLVTPIVGTSTIFVVAGAALFLQADERVTWRLVGAAAIVVVGVGLVAGA